MGFDHCIGLRAESLVSGAFPSDGIGRRSVVAKRSGSCGARQIVVEATLGASCVAGTGCASHGAIKQAGVGSGRTAELLADILDRSRLGIAIAAMIRIMATTISSSISENPFCLRIEIFTPFGFVP
jgi:hypothetical protein